VWGRRRTRRERPAGKVLADGRRRGDARRLGDPSTTRLRRWRQHGLDTLTLDVTRVRPRTLHACAQQSDPSQFPRLEFRVLYYSRFSRALGHGYYTVP